MRCTSKLITGTVAVNRIVWGPEGNCFGETSTLKCTAIYFLLLLPVKPYISPWCIAVKYNFDNLLACAELLWYDLWLA